MKQQQLSGSQPVAELPEDLKFPLTSANNVMSLESKLQDSTVKGTLVSFFLVDALLIFIAVSKYVVHNLLRQCLPSVLG